MTKPKPGATPGRPPDGKEPKVTLALRVDKAVRAYLESTGNMSKEVERVIKRVMKARGWK
jgi:hypothetical protein